MLCEKGVRLSCQTGFASSLSISGVLASSLGRGPVHHQRARNQVDAKNQHFGACVRSRVRQPARRGRAATSDLREKDLGEDRVDSRIALALEAGVFLDAALDLVAEDKAAHVGAGHVLGKLLRGVGAEILFGEGR